jgi:hypothetical protein
LKWLKISKQEEKKEFSGLQRNKWTFKKDVHT